MKSTSDIPKSLRQCNEQLKILIFSGVIIQKGSEKSLEASLIDDISTVWG